MDRVLKVSWHFFFCAKELSCQCAFCFFFVYTNGVLQRIWMLRWCKVHVLETKQALNRLTQWFTTFCFFLHKIRACKISDCWQNSTSLYLFFAGILKLLNFLCKKGCSSSHHFYAYILHWHGPFSYVHWLPKETRMVWKLKININKLNSYFYALWSS
jgi:hypothetical protein